MAEKQTQQTQKQFSGKVSEMRDSPWLSSEDLEDASSTGYIEATVTIERVMEITDAQFKGGRSKKKCYAIQFVGKTRMLVLNGVNRETLKEMFGRRATDWIGQRIVLHVKTDVQLMGKKVPGIRIKAAQQRPTAERAQPRQAATELQSMLDSEPVHELEDAPGDEPEAANGQPEATAQPLESLTPEDRAYIAELLDEIAKAPSLETLTAIGFILKAKPKPVKDAVRAAYMQRQGELEAGQPEGSE